MEEIESCPRSIPPFSLSQKTLGCQSSPGHIAPGNKDPISQPPLHLGVAIRLSFAPRDISRRVMCNSLEAASKAGGASFYASLPTAGMSS